MHACCGALFFCGFSFWAFNSWGHSYKDPRFENIKFLWPSYGGTLERIARKANRPKESIRSEIDDYNLALSSLKPGEQILYLEHEPGALIPALVGREYQGDILYLENYRTRMISSAENISDLKASFQQLHIRYVYRPGRRHSPLLEKTLILRKLRASPYPHFLVPVELLTQADTRVNKSN